MYSSGPVASLQRACLFLRAMNHDTAYFDEPDVFKPERYLDAEGRRKEPIPDTHGHDHGTFGSGRRYVLGVLTLFMYPHQTSESASGEISHNRPSSSTSQLSYGLQTYRVRRTRPLFCHHRPLSKTGVLLRRSSCARHRLTLRFTVFPGGPLPSLVSSRHDLQMSNESWRLMRFGRKLRTLLRVSQAVQECVSHGGQSAESVVDYRSM